MAKLKKCKDCGHKISKKAETCSNCGAKVSPRKPRWLLLIAVFGLIWYLGNSTSRYEKYRKPPVSSTNSTVTDEQEKKQRIEESIAKLRIDPYHKNDFPKLAGRLGDRFSESTNLRKQAAIKAIRSGKCDRLDSAEISNESTRENISFFVDCMYKDAWTRITFNESDLKDPSFVVKTAGEKAWKGPALTECMRLIKQQLQYPSSADFHTFTGTSDTVSETSGNRLVVINFEAMNALGAMLPQQGRCLIAPGGDAEVKIINR